jgi:hypothetical protein
MAKSMEIDNWYIQCGILVTNHPMPERQEGAGIKKEKGIK